MKRPRDKGSRGEREVVDIFRRHGYEGTIRSPGSGALRSYGAGDLSPWPGDLVVKRGRFDQPLPLLVEVKYDERVEAGGLRTWPGSTFLKATLRDLSKLAMQHNRGSIGMRQLIPVLVARANLSPWRFFVPQYHFAKTFQSAEDGRWLTHLAPGWVELPEELLFDHVLKEV